MLDSLLQEDQALAPPCWVGPAPGEGVGVVPRPLPTAVCTNEVIMMKHELAQEKAAENVPQRSLSLQAENLARTDGLVSSLPAVQPKDRIDKLTQLIEDITPGTIHSSITQNDERTKTNVHSTPS